MIKELSICLEDVIALSFIIIIVITEAITLVPEAFFYSLLAIFSTRTASFNFFCFFYWHKALRTEKLDFLFSRLSASLSALRRRLLHKKR